MKQAPKAIHVACGFIIGAVIIWAFSSGFRPLNPGGYNLKALGEIPIQVNGRMKPLRSKAIYTLRLLSGKSSLRTEVDGRQVKIPALQWYSMTMLNPDSTLEMPVFRIDNPEIKDDLALDADEKNFSYSELRPKLDDILAQARVASQKEANTRTRFERNILTLQQKVSTYEDVALSLTYQPDVNFASFVRSYSDLMPQVTDVPANPDEWTDEQREAFDLLRPLFQVLATLDANSSLTIIPPRDSTDPEEIWVTPYVLLMQGINAMQTETPTAAAHLATLQEAWHAGDQPEVFNQTVADLQADLAQRPILQEHGWRIGLESFFQDLKPFYHSIVMFVVVFLLTALGWLRWGNTINRYAYWLLAAAFLLTTVGLILRVVITGRPPVTNLYESTLFVGWVCVLLGLIVERIFRHGFATTGAAVIGILTLLKGFQISLDGGDTMGVLVAVLDSNFWLATHVIAITIGYGACFFAAILGHIYIFRGLFTKSLDSKSARTLELSTYGIICFGLLFSLVGTILGGIWADQSWGRFWGWDPKENGALLICLWLIIILHARMGGYLKQRGVMVAASFASVITAVSWFGVNLLGAGLHSYGFTERGILSFTLFVVIETLIVIVAALIPPGVWRSSTLLWPEGKQPTPKAAQQAG